MTGGILLALIGTWVLTQVLGGDALGRLNVARPVDTDITGVGAAVGSAVAGGATAGAATLPPRPLPRNTGRGD